MRIRPAGASVLTPIKMSLLKYFHKTVTSGLPTSTCDRETENVELKEQIGNSGESRLALEYVYNINVNYTTINVQNLTQSTKINTHTLH